MRLRTKGRAPGRASPLTAFMFHKKWRDLISGERAWRVRQVVNALARASRLLRQ